MAAGSGHCAGCGQINAVAKGAPKLEGLGEWRQIGTAHRIVTVMRDLASGRR
jgi:hypothetical protein